MPDATKLEGLQSTGDATPVEVLEGAKAWASGKVIVIAEDENGVMRWGASFGNAADLNWLLDLAKTDLAMRCLVPKPPA